MPKSIGKDIFERDQVCTIICADGQTLKGVVRLPMDDYVAVLVEPHEMKMEIQYNTMAFVVLFGYRVEIVLKD